MPHVLQSLVLPRPDLPSDELLCVRLGGDAWLEREARCIVFRAAGTATSDTFYGGLTLGLWKRRCAIRELRVAFEGCGEFLASFGVHRLSHGTVWLGDTRLALDATQPVEVEVPRWSDLEDGLLFWRVRALASGTLADARFVTDDPPVRDVRLGIVVTHFNRQAQARPAIERIRRCILERADLRGRVTLTVVDNSRNLHVLPCPGAAVIPNRNLGGTGGFVRGLLDLVDGGFHTHALFMDDDASCEPESIARTHALLAYARTRRVAVAGALMSEAEPWFTLEKGARFDGQCRPLLAGADMRDVRSLLWAERGIERPDYGGWWLFAFALADVRRWPFPFFVRGDDVLFSLANRFDVVTANGIASWGEDFRAKHGPLTAYLDARYHLLHALAGPSSGVRAVLRVARLLFLRPLLAYQYTCARAVALAMRHLAEGPSFFAAHLDLAPVRAEIASWTPDEKARPLDRAAYDAHKPRRRRREPRWRTLVRALTLQGFLLPKALIRDAVVLQEKAFHGAAAAVFRYRRILYEHFPTDTAFVAEYDRPRFFAQLANGASALATLLLRLRSLRAAHRRGWDEMTTEAFWRRVYADVLTPVVPANDASGDRIAA
jgi:GT2 family glycosyltransferase